MGYGVCSDSGEHNGQLYARAIDKMENTTGKLCELLQCVAWCSKYEMKDMDVPSKVMCYSVAKEIGCDVDCGGASRRSLSWTLGLGSALAAALPLLTVGL